jgi:Rps23 Pro-64 3,4-dihydroxylase Tpa1-like proline 4-hydroxylase
MYLSSSNFVSKIKELTGIKSLYPDVGLHGAGWHIHGTGGKLNVHLDYSIHPKLKLQRKLNLIFYLTEDWDLDWGGSLQFWSHDEERNRPKEKKVVVDNIFNRAVLFDTTQNSWHGFPEPLTCPEGVYRKSIAFYYLTDPPENVDQRKRALYAPTQEQENNLEILDLIAKRSS